MYNLTFANTVGTEISLGEFKGKVMLLVNTATQCGLASQFKELETLHQEYEGRGLVVIGFPSNQFAGQEPEANDSMAEVCQRNFV